MMTSPSVAFFEIVSRFARCQQSKCKMDGPRSSTAVATISNLRDFPYLCSSVVSVYGVVSRKSENARLCKSDNGKNCG